MRDYPVEYDYPDEMSATLVCPLCEEETYDDAASVERFSPDHTGYTATVATTCEHCGHAFHSIIEEVYGI